MASLADDDIERIAAGLVDRSLPKREWTHAAHFAAALWLLRHRPALAEPEAMRGLISGYNEATGTANTETAGYHHTITIASLRAARYHLSGFADQAPLGPVLDRLMASAQGDKEWLLAYWTRPVLFSVAARRAWVEPDLAPLPF